MPTSYLIGVISTVIAVFLAVVGFAVKDVLHGLRERIKILEAANNAAVLLTRLDAGASDREALWNQIGRSSEEGMRKSVHYSEGTCRVLSAHAQTVDARVERLEKRVFNGHER